MAPQESARGVRSQNVGDCMHWMKRFALCVCIVSVVGVFGYRPLSSDSCTCLDKRIPQFLLPDTVVVPSNIGGIPLYFPYKRAPLKRQHVKIEKYGRWHKSFVPFEILDHSNERLLGSVQTVVLLRPRDGFEPNSRYRVTYDSRFAKGTMEVQVLDSEITTENASLEIIPDTMYSGTLTIADVGRCRRTITAAQVLVGAQFVTGDPRVCNAILYFWEIGGVGRYNPSHNVCDPPKLGASWTGRNTNLFYSDCNDRMNRTGYALPSGIHEIRVVAWLPGTSETWEASELIKLQCSIDENELQSN